jgi:RNA polymerase sigma-70 factor (ECF subfamily)
VLVARHQDRVYRLAIRMSRNESDAEEIAQETFLLAYRAIGAFQGESRFSTWLYRIAVNEVLMRRRAASRRPLPLLETSAPSDHAELVAAEDGEPPDGADELVDRKRLARRVRAALGLLEEAQRTALVLRDLEELSAEEAAEILGVSPGVVRQRAHRARLKLRQELGDLVGSAASRLPVGPSEAVVHRHLDAHGVDLAAVLEGLRADPDDGLYRVVPRPKRGEADVA